MKKRLAATEREENKRNGRIFRAALRLDARYDFIPRIRAGRNFRHFGKVEDSGIVHLLCNILRTWSPRPEAAP